MLGREWCRRTAQTVLVAFGATCVACGGSPSEEVATSTVVSTTLAPPTTLSLSEVPDRLDEAELRKLVAPVALYPDVVLASLLPATTFPGQLHSAAMWVHEQGGVVDAVPQRGWDGSVAGLLQFPDVLGWADENKPWTNEMGQAMTYQQGDVLDAIQTYRHDVAEVGNLESNAFQKVERDQDEIRIQPAQPDTVYVPQYDPVAATQPQPAQQGINPWIVFGGGAVVGALGAWALYSIFDDDDDGGHGRRRRRVKKVNNYYYYGSDLPRPRAEVWTPRRRPARRRRAEAFEPKPLRHARRADRRASRGERSTGVRPPGRRPGAGTAREGVDARKIRRRADGDGGSAPAIEKGVKDRQGGKKSVAKKNAGKQGKKRAGKKTGKEQGKKRLEKQD